MVAFLTDMEFPVKADRQAGVQGDELGYAQEPPHDGGCPLIMGMSEAGVGVPTFLKQ